MDFSELSGADFDSVAAMLEARGVRTPAQLQWAAAVGAVQVLVRRTNENRWEEWHSAPWGLSDGEMMRANAGMTRLVHARLDPVVGTDWISVARALTDPERQLPDGRTLRQYAGRRLTVFRRDVLAGAESLTEKQATFGAAQAHLAVAATTLLWGWRWYGMPAWPAIVETFCAALDDATHPHWSSPGHYEALPVRPTQIAEVSVLRRVLLSGPDHLDAESARWCIAAHLPYVHVAAPDQG